MNFMKMICGNSDFKIMTYSITAEELKQLEKEYEINDIIINLNKALSKVGNVTILEALEQLKKQTRFADALNNKLKSNVI